RPVHLPRSGQRKWSELVTVDRLLGDHGAAGAVPVLPQAGALPAQHAGDAAATAGDPGEVQERSAGSAARDDALAAGGGLQPDRGLLADAAADSHVHLAVPRAAALVQLGRPLRGAQVRRPEAEPLQLYPGPDVRSRSGKAVRCPAGEFAAGYT